MNLENRTKRYLQEIVKAVAFYYSRSRNTKEMAQIIANAIKNKGLQADCKSISNLKGEVC